MRVALVHDRLNVYGGAERVLGCLHEMFPDSTVFTSIVDYSCLPYDWKNWKISTSGLQKSRLARKNHRLFLPMIALYFESLDLSKFDLVISSSYCAAKSIICQPHTPHICYCHTPFRYAWTAEPAAFYSQKSSGLSKLIIGSMMHWARVWDYSSAARVDHFIANSHTVKARIEKYYRRDSRVVHPGVDISRFQISDDIEDYYLVLSRLVPYKRIDLAIAAANKLQRRLVVIGSGPEERSLRKMAGPAVEFWGQIGDDAVTDALAHCKALLFPGEEDFGLTPVEAQASGRPVVAYGHGGATETVIDGVTGLLFHENTVDALCEAIAKLDSLEFSPNQARSNAERFSIEAFRRAFTSILNDLMIYTDQNRPMPPHTLATLDMVGH